MGQSRSGNGGSKRKRQRGKNTAAAIERAAKDRRAIELRDKGLTFDEIATELGMSNRSVAYKAFTRGLARWASAEVDELRALDAVDLLVQRPELADVIDATLTDQPTGHGPNSSPRRLGGRPTRTGRRATPASHSG